MSIKDGGPAFPVSTRQHESEPGYGHQDSASTWQFGGMTLRDYFAAKAMQGEIASCTNGQVIDANKCASWCYQMADAMLAARTKP